MSPLMLPKARHYLVISCTSLACLMPLFVSGFLDATFVVKLGPGSLAGLGHLELPLSETQ
jgi:hypothetical protein